MRQIGLTCRSFTLFSFSVCSLFSAMDARCTLSDGIFVFFQDQKGSLCFVAVKLETRIVIINGM